MSSVTTHSNESQDPAATLLYFPRPGRALLGACALLLALRLALLWLPEHHAVQVDTTRQHRYYEAELELRTAGRPSPEVVIFGTSRLRLLKPADLATRLSLPPDMVVNLSGAGIRYWHILAFLRRNPSLVRSAKVLFVDLIPSQVFESPAIPECDTLFLRYSTLAERWRVRDPVQRLKALVDLVAPLWSERMTVYNWRRAVFGYRMPAPERLARHREVGLEAYPDMVELRARQSRQTLAESFEAVLSVLFPRASHFMPGQAEALREIRRLLPRDCTLFLVWLPIREDTLERVRTSEKWGPALEAYREYFESIDLVNTRRLWFDLPSSLEMVDTDFTGDGIHLAGPSVGRMSDRIANIVKTALDSPP